MKIKHIKCNIKVKTWLLYIKIRLADGTGEGWDNDPLKFRSVPLTPPTKGDKIGKFKE